MKKRIHKLFFYALLVGVYGIFFAVESFCNFEGQTNGQDFIHVAAHFCQHAGGGRVAKSAPLRSASSHNVRLNKRFYQADMPPCPVLAPQSPLTLLSPLVLGSRRSNDLSELAALYRALRGPPAIG